MEPTASHWLIALAGALGVHLSLLPLFERPAEPATPAQGILIELGNRAEAGDGSSETESLSPLGAESLPETESVAPQTMESVAYSEITAAEMDTVELEGSEDLVAMAETVPMPNAEGIVAKSPAPAKPATTTRPKPKAKKTRSSTKIKKKAPKTRHDKKIAKVSARKAVAGGGKAKAGKGFGKQDAGTGSDGSSAAAKGRYAGQISAWLNRNKQYPRQARQRRHQGLVTIRFTVDRDGRVLSSNIVRSSGHTTLDDEVRALMRRGRMPRMPAAMKQAQITMTVPIRFQLR